MSESVFTDWVEKLSYGKRMDIWTVVRTILEKNSGIRAKELVQKVRERTDLSRSTIYDHFGSWVLREECFREKGRYYLPKQWRRHNLEDIGLKVRPRIRFWVTQSTIGSFLKRELPTVGFNLKNQSTFPVRIRLRISVILGGRNLGLINDKEGYYNGVAEIGAEPGEGFANGNFVIPKECVQSIEKLVLEVRAIAIDENEQKHELLPKSWAFIRGANKWHYEPKAFTKKENNGVLP